MKYRDRIKLMADKMLQERDEAVALAKCRDNTSEDTSEDVGFCQTYVRASNSLYEYSLS